MLAAFLVVGFICNALVRPVAAKWFMPEDEVAALQNKSSSSSVQIGAQGIGAGAFDAKAFLAWAFVGIPIAWGVYMTYLNVVKLFN